MKIGREKKLLAVPRRSGGRASEWLVSMVEVLVRWRVEDRRNVG